MKAIVKNVRISPKKANLVAGLVRKKMALEAVDFLKFTDKKAAKIVNKVILSAISNAENNFSKSKLNLKIESILVTKGRVFQRGIPASRGRVAPIKKRTSHIFIELSEIEKKEEKNVTKKNENGKKSKQDIKSKNKQNNDSVTK